MPIRPEIIRYLHDCYREDNSRSVLWNLFGSGVEHLIFLKGNEELFASFLDETPLIDHRAHYAAQAAVTYQKEKQLLYTAFPIIGKMALPDGKTRSVCAPLLTFPATIKVDGNYAALSIHREGRRINSGLLDVLQSDLGDTPLSDLIEAAFEDWQINEADVSAAAKILEAGIGNLNTSTMWEFPKLTEGKHVRAATKNAKLNSRFKILPAVAVALVKRPTESRGILTELQEIANSTTSSAPLHAIITGEIPLPSEPNTEADTIPAVLSHSQTNILQRARTEPLSLVIGPPGTGKSYTIAAIALDHLHRGQSVVIGSKMNHAVDVIAGKIEDQLGASGKVVRAGRRHYLRELKSYIDSLLNSPKQPPGETATTVESLTKAFNKTDHDRHRLESEIEDNSQRHIKWGETLAALAAGSRNLFKHLSGFFIARRHHRTPPLWDQVSELHQLLNQRTFLSAELVKRRQDLRIEQGLEQNRHAIRTLRTALGARTGSRQEQLFASIDLNTLLRILPVWLTNLSDAHRVLPNERELFDVAIIDEASQCDIASCLPLLQRAKRAVIVGDPKQLRHLSFLATDRQSEFAKNHQLTELETTQFNYRNHSILDLASERTESQSCINFLNEHYRSAPPIISFSNTNFYADKLNVMTEKPGNDADPAVFHHHVKGERDKAGINAIEAEALITSIEAHLRKSNTTPDHSPPSIGILSPFRAQVDHIAARINQRLGTEIFTKYQLLIGTAHTFQGEERDQMFISFAIDSASPAASRRFLERPDLFNVAITRARAQQHNFTSINANTLPQDSLLRKYLTHIRTANTPSNRTSQEQLALIDRFVTDVKQALESKGFKIWLATPVAGLKIDVLAIKDSKSLAIDLIGCPGPTSPVLPLERYKMFRRAGLTLWPLPYTNWIHNKQQCLQAIEAAAQRS